MTLGAVRTTLSLFAMLSCGRSKEAASLTTHYDESISEGVCTTQQCKSTYLVISARVSGSGSLVFGWRRSHSQNAEEIYVRTNRVLSVHMFITCLKTYFESIRYDVSELHCHSLIDPARLYPLPEPSR